MDTKRFDFDESEEIEARFAAIGLDEIGNSVVRSASNIPKLSCVERPVPQGDAEAQGNDELFATARTNDFVFLVMARGNDNANALRDALADAARDAGSFPVALFLNSDPTQGSASELSLCSHEKPGYPTFTIDPRAQSFDQSLFPQSRDGSSQILHYLARHVIDAAITSATVHGMICVDLADVIAVLSGGHGHVGVGVANGDQRSSTATYLALDQLAKQNVKLEESSGVLARLEGDSNITMEEYDDVSRIIHSVVHEDANVITTVFVNGLCGSNVKVTIIAVDDTFGHCAHIKTSQELKAAI